MEDRRGVVIMSNITNGMPLLFIGHGSPMNAIENNEFTKNWTEIALKIGKPKAILSISAHWYTDGTRINDEKVPKIVYDMYGFPKELYDLVYNASGAPEIAHIVEDLLSREVRIDNSWGIDHGTWSVSTHMYPAADIPLLQMSIDMDAPAATHFAIGKELKALREQGVLILGSGNVVHNLALVNWDMETGYAWADDFDKYIKDKIATGKYEDVIDYKKAGPSSDRAFYTPEHFYPLLYIIGASDKADKLTVYNDKRIMGAISMTCYLFE